MEFQREILPLTIFDNDLQSSVFYSNFQSAAPNFSFYLTLSMQVFIV